MTTIRNEATDKLDSNLMTHLFENCQDVGMSGRDIPRLMMMISSTQSVVMSGMTEGEFSDMLDAVVRVTVKEVEAMTRV